MSQIIGYFSPTKNAARQKQLLRKILPTATKTAILDNFCIRCDGVPDTQIWQQDDKNRGFLVGGFALQAGDFKPLGKAQWEALLQQKPPSLQQLNGHFFCLIWQEEHIRFFTDALGLRTIFLRENGQGLFFSSRLDWLNQTRQSAEINPAAFGSHWLAFNALRSDQALTTGVCRLGPGSVASFDLSGLKITQQRWSIVPVDSAEKQLNSKLDTIFESLSSRPVSLGLSGGLDSRLLLSIALKGGHPALSTHVFGPQDHPDVEIAQQITAKFTVPHKPFSDFHGDTSELAARAGEYCCVTNAIAPASTAMRLAHYHELQQAEKFVIDGGFGEIGRRQFLNRLRFEQGSKLQQPDFVKIFACLRYERGNFLHPDFRVALEKAALEELQYEWQNMPDIAEIPLHDFLDLFALRSRLPNYYAYEQARLDTIVPNLMPFAQPKIISLLLNLPLNARQNSALFRKLLRQNCNRLTSFPLVKGTATYPFSCGTISAKIWTQTKVKLRLTFVDKLQFDFLLQLREFVHDLVRSQEIRQNPLYNKNALDELVREFYRGNNAKATELDWWLALEFWRQGNKIN